MQQIIPFGALLLRLKSGEQKFSSQKAWKLLKRSTSELRSAARSFAVSPKSRVISRINQVVPERVVEGKSDTNASAAKKDESPADSIKRPGLKKSRTSLGFERLTNTETEREKARKERCARCQHYAAGALFIVVGIFILVTLAVQLNRNYCQIKGNWQEHCALWAFPLFSLSSCPCTMLEYKCGTDVERGWEHSEVLFGCKQNASEFDYSDYSPTPVRSCDSNRDCNTFAYCNSKGRCANCNLCEHVCICLARMLGLDLSHLVCLSAAE